jgi:hypothetical protein
MKKLILALAFLFVASTAYCQNNCPKILKLLKILTQGTLAEEFTTSKFTTSEDFDAYISVTQLDGAMRCYVQDAFNRKMYVAEFGASDQSSKELENSFSTLSNMLDNCLRANFVHGQVKINGQVLKGVQYEGKGTYINIKVMLMLVNNPSSKKYELFMSIAKD